MNALTTYNQSFPLMPTRERPHCVKLIRLKPALDVEKIILGSVSKFAVALETATYSGSVL